MKILKLKIRLRLLIKAFRIVGAHKLMIGYVVVFFLAAIPIWLMEPSIKSYGDSLWFCFASVSTIGYGDILVSNVLPRVITVILSIYSVAIVAIFTAVIVGFFNDMSKMRLDKSVHKFSDDLLHLPDLSKEELESISNRVREFLYKKT